MTSKALLLTCASLFAAFSVSAQDATNSVPHASTSPFVAPAPKTAPVLEKKDSFYDTYLAMRLSAGLTFVKTSMDKTHVPYDSAGENNFLGNINNLNENDMSDFGIILRYEISPYIALQFSTGTTIDLEMWNNERESRDANFDADGKTFEVLFMYPFDEYYVTPYVGLGFTLLDFSIDYNNWWHYGWGSPDAYDQYSSTYESNISRWMILDPPSSAFAFTLGISADLWRHIQFDLFYRITNADDCKIEFRRVEYGHSRHMLNGYVPMDYSSFGIALRGVF